MYGLGIGLVLTSTSAHAGWNVLAKRAGPAGTAYVAATAAASATLWAAPVLALLLVTGYRPSRTGVVFLIGAGVLHTTYFLALARAYRGHDLSVVYPVARGVAPLAASAVAVALLGDRVTPLGVLGILAISLGVLALGWPGRQGATPSLRGVGWGLGIAAVITAYTVWDAHSVASLGTPPLVQEWAGEAGRALLLAGWVAHHQDRVRRAVRRYRREIVGQSLLSPASYLLVLTAYRYAPVTVVAPLREVGVLLGVVAGIRLFGEPAGRRRLLAAALVVVGAGMVAMGG
ncbi:MAG: EamA family transporter [Actinomycetes bacterium]